MNPELSDIAEVVTVGKKDVNRYLEAGYRLLAIEQAAIWKTSFVLGRPADVEPIDGQNDAAKDG